MTRTIKVNYLARVEGEGALTLRFSGNRAESVELNIFEPPRFFEGLLAGRAFHEAPDLTARICGICPVAYQMTACHALESLSGVELPDEVKSLRRLLYAGEWIESHALHMFMLHLPDFLGYEDALGLAKKHPDLIKSGLAIKKAGNRILQVLGGREIHPINVKLGGFFRQPPKAELAELEDELRLAQTAMDEALDFFHTLEFPAFERPYEFVALRHPTDYPFNEGRIVSSQGIDIDAAQYEDHFRELQVRHSTALHSEVIGRGGYLCGPLARLNLNFDLLRPAARAAAERVRFSVPCENPFKSLLVRGIETIQVLDEARAIVGNYQAAAPASLDFAPRAGIGHACTEAPRGLQYQRYELDSKGNIVTAKIVPPTSQNQRAIEEDLFAMAPELASMPHANATWRAEQAIRNYDPCISCSTHFLKLAIERR